jgi:external thioesterase TEII
MTSPLLIMLPFAGGNAYSYRSIVEYLPPGIEVLCPELPGRGILTDRRLIRDMDLLAEFVLTNYLESTDLNRPYMLFGHSMGSLLVYLLARKIVAKRWNLPLHLCVSGRGGPSLERKKALTYNLPSREFRKEIGEMGGTRTEVLSESTLMDYFEPILRADFEAIEKYIHKSSDSLAIPITLFYGSCEKSVKYSAHLWELETSRLLVIKEMEGDHFFLFQHQPEIAAYLSNLLGVKSENEHCLLH